MSCVQVVIKFQNWSIISHKMWNKIRFIWLFESVKFMNQSKTKWCTRTYVYETGYELFDLILFSSICYIMVLIGAKKSWFPITWCPNFFSWPYTFFRSQSIIFFYFHRSSIFKLKIHMKMPTFWSCIFRGCLWKHGTFLFGLTSVGIVQACRWRDWWFDTHQ